MPFDEHSGKRKEEGGDGGNCIDALSSDRQTQLATLVADKITNLCYTMATEYEMCPVCAINSVVQIIIRLTSQHSMVTPIITMQALMDSFNQAFSDEDIRVISVVVEENDERQTVSRGE